MSKKKVTEPKSKAVTKPKVAAPATSSSTKSLANSPTDDHILKLVSPVWTKDFEVRAKITEAGPYSKSPGSKEISLPASEKNKLHRLTEDEETQNNISSEILLFKPDWWKRLKQERVPTSMSMASLVALGSTESKTKKPIITSRLYPQNASGAPIVNPNGIYHFRAFINGEDRLVAFDDKLWSFTRYDKYGYKVDYFAATQSVDDSEWGVSLLEKAYIQWEGESYKIGGDNPHKPVLFYSGFLVEMPIPITNFLDKVEKNTSINSGPPAKAFGLGRESGFGGKSSYWDDLVANFTAGNVVGILGSIEEEQKPVDVVPGHGFAVVGAFTLKNGTKLLRVLNPQHTEPVRASFDPSGKSKWAAGIKEITGEEPPTLQLPERKPSICVVNNEKKEVASVELDDVPLIKDELLVKKKAGVIHTGEFYLSLDMLKSRFDEIYLAWNPALFTSEKKLKTTYKEGDIYGDRKTWARNPQFLLHKKKGVRTWVQLIRHLPPAKPNVLDQYEDLHAQLRVKRQGASKPAKLRVTEQHNKDDPEDYSTYSPGIDYLVKLDVDYDGYYTLTIDFHSPPKNHGDVHFTLRVLSTGPADEVVEVPI